MSADVVCGDLFLLRTRKAAAELGVRSFSFPHGEVGVSWEPWNEEDLRALEERQDNRGQDYSAPPQRGLARLWRGAP